MSKEIGYYARNYGRDRNELKAFVEALLPPERIKKTKGLLWIDDEGIPLLEAALNHPEKPAKVEPVILSVLIRPGARNPRFEFAQTAEGEKIGVLIPSNAKGRYIGRKVQVECVVDNDGTKIYRLLCRRFQSITE